MIEPSWMLYLLALGAALALASADSTDHPLVKTAVSEIIKMVENGFELSDGLAWNKDLFGSSLPQMVKMGEESSTLTAAFGYMANYYDLQVSYAIDNLGSILEPLLLLLVAAITGTMLISIFLPLYSFVGAFSG